MLFHSICNHDQRFFFFGKYNGIFLQTCAEGLGGGETANYLMSNIINPM
eukprot:UN02401